ncbi:MAG: Crp/Fnr family transcriptional regulator [Polyangiales bacterium]
MIAIESLRELPVFHDYEDRDLAVLLGSSSEREYAPGAPLCEQGQRGRSCFLVVSGEVDLLRAAPEGPLRLGRRGPGMFLGTLSLVDGGARPTTAIAATDVCALEFERDVFDALVRAQSPLALRFQRQIALAGIRTLRNASAQLLAILSAPPREADAAAEAETDLWVDRPDRADRTVDALRYIQATADEWGIPLDDVDSSATSRPGRRPSSRPPRRA